MSSLYLMCFKNTGTFLQNVLFYSPEMQTVPMLFNILKELSHPEEMSFKLKCSRRLLEVAGRE